MYRRVLHERKLCTPIGTQLGYAGCMTELEKGPRGLRRGRGAQERILSASRQLFRDQGINCTGMDQICAVAQVSKRTFYQHFTGKDELIAEHLRRLDPDGSGTARRRREPVNRDGAACRIRRRAQPNLTPREKLKSPTP